MKLKCFFSILFILILTGACSSKKDVKLTELSDGKLVSYAENLEIVEQKGSVLIHIKNPETHEIERRFVLQKKNGNIPDGYIRINTPIKSIITLSSTQIGMLAKLKKTEVIIGISNHNYVEEPSILKRFRQGDVIEMGEEGTIPVESIIASKTQILMYSGFGKTFSHEEQLERLGVTCIANYDWRENHPLGKAEWIKLFGYLTGKEKEAFAYFEKIEKEYKALVALARTSKTQPTLFSGNMAGDIWNSPAGDSYNAILFKDAKCNYVYAASKGTGSVSKSFEQILVDNKNTEFWINPGMFDSKQELFKFQPKFKHFEAVKNNKVYTYSYTGNQFWERSGIEPHHVLADLIQILHPELPHKKKLYFYRKLD